MDELINFEDLKEADDLLFKNAQSAYAAGQFSSELDSQHSSFSGLNRSLLKTITNSPLVTTSLRNVSSTSPCSNYRNSSLSKHADKPSMTVATNSDTDLNRIISTATLGSSQDDVLFDLDSVTLQVSGSLESLSIVEGEDEQKQLNGGTAKLVSSGKEVKLDGYVVKPLPDIPSSLTQTVATEVSGDRIEKSPSFSADISFGDQNGAVAAVSSVLDNFVLDSPNTSLCQTPRSLLVATGQTPVKSPTYKPSISEDRYRQPSSPALSLSPATSHRDAAEEPELDDSPPKPFGSASQLRRVPSRLRSPTKHISAFRNKPASFSPQATNNTAGANVAGTAVSARDSPPKPMPTAAVASSLSTADKPVIKRGFLFRSGSMMNRKRDATVKPVHQRPVAAASTNARYLSVATTNSSISSASTTMANSPDLLSPPLTAGPRHSRSHSMESSVLVNTASTPSLLRRPSIITKKLQDVTTTTAAVQEPTSSKVTAPPVYLASPSGASSAIPRLTSRIRSRFFDKKS